MRAAASAAAVTARASGRARAVRGWWRSLGDAAFVPVDIASLACFRVAFGAVMFWEVCRYFSNGWIATYYIEPGFHFTYYGFGWVRPWPGDGMYLHFAALGVAALGIAAGLRYRLCAAAFFLGFTYVFLLDQVRYLNHFYLISLVALLLVFAPVHRAASLDAWRRPHLRSDTAPAWALWILRAQVGIPYFYGGVAKLNGDWLRGEPIRSWLAGRPDFPLIGRFFGEEWMVYTFAYGGLLLDLLVVPALMWRRTRPLAFAAALSFHGTNAVLFRIGVFPWMMMAATTIFFAPDWPRRLASWIRGGALAAAGRPAVAGAPPGPRARRLTLAGLAAWLAVQALVPLRHLLYPGNVSWTEEGHRFAWHMKLRDKEARATFTVTDPASGRTRTVRPSTYLTRLQARRMAAHPDMILQLAHHISREERRAGRPGVEVRADALASLNGREPQPLVYPDVDLAVQPRNLAPAAWIVPLYEPLPAPHAPPPPGDADE